MDDGCKSPDPDSLVARIDIRSAGRRLPAWVPAAGLIAMLLGVIFIPYSEAAGAWWARQAMKREMLKPGLACPRVEKLSIAAMGAKPPKPFDYKAAHFAFQIGDVDCEAAPVSLFGDETFPVCRFSAPAGIEVTAYGRTTIFEPGVGHSATVAVHPDGTTTCTIGGAFRVEETR
jgi:hypothetical protein